MATHTKFCQDSLFANQSKLGKTKQFNQATQAFKTKSYRTLENMLSDWEIKRQKSQYEQVEINLRVKPTLTMQSVT